MSNTSPLISVIVPCYNQAQYLDECLQSVLDQTYQDWECIIVNDGSPDNTEEITKQWTEKDARFKYLYKENGGLSSARNAGIEIAKGEWILPLDADDKIGKQYLELAEKEFDQGYTVIYCEAEFFGAKVGKWELPYYTYERILIDNIIFCAGFFQKKEWINCMGYDENLKHGREDWDFWLSILDRNKTVYKICYLGFFYRRKDISMDVVINQDPQILKSVKKFIFIKHYDKYVHQFGDFYTLINENKELRKNNQKLLDLANEPLTTKLKRKIFK